MSQKLMQLGSPNLTQAWSTMSHGNQKVKGEGHVAQKHAGVSLHKESNTDVCCWVSPCHVCTANAADHRFFHGWSFSQSASNGLGHGARESADFF